MCGYNPWYMTRGIVLSADPLPCKLSYPSVTMAKWRGEARVVRSFGPMSFMLQNGALGMRREEDKLLALHEIVLLQGLEDSYVHGNGEKTKKKA